MKIVKRNRYYCEFCKKAGGSGGHIAKHERSCTKNPNRICRVCGMLEVEQKPMAELKSGLPQYGKSFEIEFDATSEVEERINALLPTLREKANNCPACIMAALRQSGIPVPMASKFSFKDEMKAIWDAINEMKLQEYGHGFDY